MKLKHFEEQVFFATVRILSVGPEGEASVGTGFLVETNVTDERKAILAVSNKHVLIDRSRHMVLEFTKSDAGQPLLGETVRLQGSALSDLHYFEHPTADLACLNVSMIGQSSVYHRTLDLKAISATFDEPNLVPGREVIFVGYPDGRYDTKNNLPILRGGRIASIPTVDFDGEKQFLIDAHVDQGSSGSPVFMIPGPLGGEVKFLGVLTQALIKHEKLGKIPINFERFGFKRTIGLGCVLKPPLVTELANIAADRLAAHLKEHQPAAPHAALPDQPAAAPG